MRRQRCPAVFAAGIPRGKLPGRRPLGGIVAECRLRGGFLLPPVSGQGPGRSEIWEAAHEGDADMGFGGLPFRVLCADARRRPSDKASSPRSVPGMISGPPLPARFAEVPGCPQRFISDSGGRAVLLPGSAALADRVFQRPAADDGPVGATAVTSLRLWRSGPATPAGLGCRPPGFAHLTRLDWPFEPSDSHPLEDGLRYSADDRHDKAPNRTHIDHVPLLLQPPADCPCNIFGLARQA